MTISNADYKAKGMLRFIPSSPSAADFKDFSTPKSLIIAPRQIWFSIEKVVR
jgi:hypothetical protein